MYIKHRLNNQFSHLHERSVGHLKARWDNSFLRDTLTVCKTSSILGSSLNHLRGKWPLYTPKLPPRDVPI